MTPADEANVAGALMLVAGAVTREQAHEALVEAMRRGLPMQKAAEVMDRWTAANAPQVVGAPRCHCGRSVPTSSLCGCCCANHDSEITA